MPIKLIPACQHLRRDPSNPYGTRTPHSRDPRIDSRKGCMDMLGISCRNKKLVVDLADILIVHCSRVAWHWSALLSRQLSSFRLAIDSAPQPKEEPLKSEFRYIFC
jgi:hypothetical protein